MKGKKQNDSSIEIVHYDDPADDTDEDLSMVPEDYGKSRNTKKLKFRLTDRWTR